MSAPVVHALPATGPSPEEPRAEPHGNAQPNPQRNAGKAGLRYRPSSARSRGSSVIAPDRQKSSSRRKAACRSS